MKKILLISIIILTLVSCGKNVSIPEPSPYHDAPTQFIVIDIQQLDGMKLMTNYRIEIIDANGVTFVNDGRGNISNVKFWMCDSLGKYKLGQPIKFDKNR